MTDAQAAREYIRNFKHVLGAEATYCETSTGRKIVFATMTDEEAIDVARMLLDMEMEATVPAKKDMN